MRDRIGADIYKTKAGFTYPLQKAPRMLRKEESKIVAIPDGISVIVEK